MELPRSSSGEYLQLMRHGCTTMVFVCVASVSSGAAADETAECVHAYEQAQVLQKASKLLDARMQMLKCAHVRCPDIVRGDCVQWLNAVDAQIPSIVLGAVGPDGHDVIAVQVWVDGRKALDGLDGRALPMDPGPHHFRFVVHGAEPVELQVLVREGEMRRPLIVRFQPAKEVAAPQRPVPVASWLLWGAGGVGVGAFAILGLQGRSELDHLSETCKPNCSKADEDAAWRKLAAADVCGAVGLVALGAGTWIYVARPTRSPAAASLPQTLLSFRGLPGGGWLGARLAF
jgi:hypothetical protein